MFNNQKTNKNAVQLLSEFNEAWVEKNPQEYCNIALEAVSQDGMALEYTKRGYLRGDLKKYYKAIVMTAVKKDGLALYHVNKNWASKDSERYKKIALAAVKQKGMALYALDAMILLSTQYYDIVLEAVSQNGMALEVVSEELLKNPELYKKIALEAVSQNGMALAFVGEELQNNQKIVLAALSQDELALEFAGEVFRNNIKIAISSLIRVDSKYSKHGYGFNLKGMISKILSMASIKNDILLYVHMFNNQNVSNKFKNALFNFFIKAFKYTSSDKFTLYKNILECYLVLSEGYKEEFKNDTLLANLSKYGHKQLQGDSKQLQSKQLHMFLSLADPSALKNAKLAEFLNNDHNDIIKNYLTKDTNNLKSIKNFNIYSSLLPKNLFVINYDKIINTLMNNKMKNNTLMNNKMKNDNLIKLILCYFRIEDLLKLSEGLNLGDKLQVKYLDIVPKFEREDVASTGIEAFVDAITSQNGYLSNKVNYQYDTCSTIYNLLDIELSQHNKLIE